MEHLNKIVSIKVFENKKFKLLKINNTAEEWLYGKMDIYRNEPNQYTLYMIDWLIDLTSQQLNIKENRDRNEISKFLENMLMMKSFK